MAGNTPIADVPDAPTIGVATAGTESATVTYTAAATGGTATTFTATSSPGSITGTGSSPITVTGLTGGTAYTFTVRGSNSTGTSPASAATSPVTPTLATSFESIATVTVGSGGAAQIDFTSIPSGFTHLQIRYMWRSSNAAEILVTYNGASSYYRHLLYGSGGGVAATGNSTNVFGGYYEPTANVFSVGVMDILDYKNTNKNKVARVLWGFDANGSGYLGLNSGYSNATNAITSITLSPSGGGGISQYSHFALYGIKES